MLRDRLGTAERQACRYVRPASSGRPAHFGPLVSLPMLPATV
jgi:hypothetical protein